MYFNKAVINSLRAAKSKKDNSYANKQSSQTTPKATKITPGVMSPVVLDVLQRQSNGGALMNTHSYVHSNELTVVKAGFSRPYSILVSLSGERVATRSTFVAKAQSISNVPMMSAQPPVVNPGIAQVGKGSRR